MDNEKERVKGFFQCLSDLAAYIDKKLRFGDLDWNRTADGYLDLLFGINRHSYQYLALPMLVTGIIVMGLPELGLRLVWAFGVSILVLLLLILLGWASSLFRFSIRTELMIQVSIVLAVAGAVWLHGGNIYQKGGDIYRHFFIVAAFVLGVALIITGFLAKWVWSNWPIQNNYQQAITKTELFLSPEKKIPLKWRNFLMAFFTVFQGAPLQLLLFPALLALLWPPDILLPLTIVAFTLSYGMLLMGGFNARLNQMWDLLQSAFFRGGTRWVSLVIIVLSATRLFGVSYVTTVFDTAQGTVIALLLISAYALLWWYDYWTNRLLAQELIRMLNPKASCDVKILYPVKSDSINTSVLKEGRVIQIHGASRFIVIGSSMKDSRPRFQAYRFGDLFRTLATSGFPGGKAVPSPRQIEERIFDYKVLSATVLVLLSALVWWCISSGVQMPQLVVKNNTRPCVELARLLDDHMKDGKEQPAIMIAASGGGTRAALYTAAVMEGLAKQNKIKDVIMGSGVSGGGAALAYFAGSRLLLVDQDDFSNGWNNIFKAMKKSYIVDVLNSAVEWRTVSSSRLGLLLYESFKDGWELPESRNRLGDVKDFGLILNTAIAGRFNYSPALEKHSFYRSVTDALCKFTAPSNCSSLTKAECRFRKYSSSELAGGRLILTNLLLGDCFVETTGETGGPKGLPIVVHDPDTRLENAAALNANFPPVFSNAGIDVGDTSRYWVTDGGAVDNRGVEMLLYAFHDALIDKDECTSARIKSLPKVTLVIVDASAYSDKYSQDRGIGSAMSAGTQVTSLLAEKQLRLIKKIYKDMKQKDDFKVVYLPMPLCLRESGSFGTHWMLQPNIKITLDESSLWKRFTMWVKSTILRNDPGPGGSRTLEGDEVIKLLRVMHGNGRREKLSSDAQDVLKYMVQDEGWRKGARQLGFVKE